VLRCLRQESSTLPHCPEDRPLKPTCTGAGSALRRIPVFEEESTYVVERSLPRVDVLQRCSNRLYWFLGGSFLQQRIVSSRASSLHTTVPMLGRSLSYALRREPRRSNSTHTVPSRLPCTGALCCAGISFSSLPSSDLSHVRRSVSRNAAVLVDQNDKDKNVSSQ
jgi:hypothetical protein